MNNKQTAYILSYKIAATVWFHNFQDMYVQNFICQQKLESSSVRCSVIGLAAEVRLCKTLTQKTDGSYAVIMNETHFRDILLAHVRPPAAKVSYCSLVVRYYHMCMQSMKFSVQVQLCCIACHPHQVKLRWVYTGYSCGNGYVGLVILGCFAQVIQPCYYSLVHSGKYNSTEQVSQLSFVLS